MEIYEKYASDEYIPDECRKGKAYINWTDNIIHVVNSVCFLLDEAYRTYKKYDDIKLCCCIIERNSNNSGFTVYGDPGIIDGHITSMHCGYQFTDHFHIQIISDDKMFIRLDGYKQALTFREKKIFIINGVPMAGKDTLIKEGAKSAGSCSPSQIISTSTVDPIKDIAIRYGMWDGKEKTDRDRKLLSEMKQVITSNTDMITEYILNQVRMFLIDCCTSAMFIHCREPKEIDILKESINNEINKFTETGSQSVQFAPDKCRTLIVRRDEVEKNAHGNDSDDKVLDYTYDVTFYNNAPLKESAELFGDMIDEFTCRPDKEQCGYPMTVFGTMDVMEIGSDINTGKSYVSSTDEDNTVFFVKNEKDTADKLSAECIDDIFHKPMSDTMKTLLLSQCNLFLGEVDFAVKKHGNMDNVCMLVSVIDALAAVHKRVINSILQEDEAWNIHNYTDKN